MATEFELDNFLLELEPTLEDLERQRVTLLTITFAMVAAVVIAITVGFLNMESEQTTQELGSADAAGSVLALLFNLVIIMTSVASGVVALSKYLFGGRYVRSFKDKVIAKIMYLIEPGLTYEPSKYISPDTFDRSKLFTSARNRFRGDDFVQGKIGQTEVAFSELNVTRQTSNGKHSRTITVFKGLFLVASFPKPVRCRLGTSNQLGSEKIEMDDPEFDAVFDVFSDDPVEAFYLLSNSFLRRLTDFHAKTGLGLDFSLLDNKLFMAIHFERDLLEPPLFKDLFRFEIYEEYLRDLQLFTGVVEDLNLNTEIWSHEHQATADEDLVSVKKAPQNPLARFVTELVG
jgi:hypothetical protein